MPPPSSLKISRILHSDSRSVISASFRFISQTNSIVDDESSASTNPGAAIHAPFASHQLSATVRFRSNSKNSDRKNMSLSSIEKLNDTLSLRRPVPGRLLRCTSPLSHEIAEDLSSSPVNSGNGSNVTLPQNGIKNAKQNSKLKFDVVKQEVVSRRRLFLEKSVSSLSSSSLLNIDTSSKNNGSDGISHTTAHPNAEPPTRYPRVLVHSPNDGRIMSAADVYRSQRNHQRIDQSKEPQSHHSSRCGNEIRNRTSSSERAAVGGSVVASQCATLRYRQSLRPTQTTYHYDGKLKDSNMQIGEGNLKVNPSVMSIPLVDLEGSRSNAVEKPLLKDSNVSNFEERYQTLCQQRDALGRIGTGEIEGRTVEREGWSLFRWFVNWGMK